MSENKYYIRRFKGVGARWEFHEFDDEKKALEYIHSAMADYDYREGNIVVIFGEQLEIEPFEKVLSYRFKEK